MTKPTIIVLLSGGLDSTGMLYKYLTETNYNIVVLNIRLRFKDNIQHLVTSIVVENCVNWLKINTRDFTFVKSFMDLSCIGSAEQAILGFFTGQYILANYDRLNIEAVIRGIYFSQYSSPKSKIRVNMFFRSYNACFYDRLPIPIIYPLERTSKVTYFKTLPIDLRKLTWACFNPIIKDNYYCQCNNCDKCTELNNFDIIHNKIKI